MDLMKEQKFGFGCMRMPVLDKADPTSFDYEEIERLFDCFLEQGFTYSNFPHRFDVLNLEKSIL